MSILLVVFFAFLMIVVISLTMNHLSSKVKAADQATDHLRSKRQIKQAPEPASDTVTDKNGQKYTVLASFTRNSRHYTQGLAFSGEYLIECTGEYGKSSVQTLAINEAEGSITNRKTKILEAVEFGQGCAVLNEHVIGLGNAARPVLYQITWKNRALHRYVVPSGFEESNMAVERVETMAVPDGVEEFYGLTNRLGFDRKLYSTDGKMIYEMEISTKQ